jgi:hypothetical protein
MNSTTVSTYTRIRSLFYIFTYSHLITAYPLNPDDLIDPPSPTCPLRAIHSRRGEATSRLNCEANTKQSIAVLFYSHLRLIFFSLLSVYSISSLLSPKCRVCWKESWPSSLADRGVLHFLHLSPPQTPISSANP